MTDSTPVEVYIIYKERLYSPINNDEVRESQRNKIFSPIEWVDRPLDYRTLLLSISSRNLESGL